MSDRPLIVDCDPGIDDAVALALTARSEELSLAAVTTSYGNATLEATTRNAHVILDLVGSRAPIHAGAAAPIERSLVTAPETHGPTGVGYAPVGEAPAVAANNVVLLDLLREVDEQVTLVTLGPLTNLAHALARDSSLVKRRIHRHIGMFGNIHERGNTNRWADFNAWCDPEAVEAVLQSGLETEMVGLDVTRRMSMSAGEVERLQASENPLRSWLGQALRFYVEFHRAEERLNGCVVNDILPIGELVSPSLLRFEALELAVDLDDGDHRGHTRERANGSVTPVALNVDVARMKTLLDRVFGSGWKDANADGKVTLTEEQA